MFSVGDKVCLKIDSSKIGAVIAVTPVGDTTYQYIVFHNANETGTYYEDQLLPIKAETITETTFHDFLGAYAAFKMKLDSTSTIFSLNTGNIKFIPFQFRPLSRILNAERPRILIADEVGVGKTIETGLILKEFEKRDLVRSVLIICPKELTEKWRSEMKLRFDEAFEILSSDRLQYCFKELEMDGYWPEECSKCIIGLEMFRRQENIDQLEGIEDLARFDMLIVDEAHHIINPSSNSHRIVEYFCECCNTAVFLSATPLQLGSSDLFSLLNLLLPEEYMDKDIFDTMAEPNRYINAAIHHVRSNRADWQEQVIGDLSQINVNSWAENVFSTNSIFQYWLKRLSTSDRPLTNEERIDCLKDLESLHTFSHIINRTKRKDIGEFTIREPITVKITYSPEEQAFYNAVKEFKSTILNVRYGMRTANLIMSTIERQITSCLPAFVTLLDTFIECGLQSLTELTDNIDYEVPITDDDHAFRDYATKLKSLAGTIPPRDAKTEQLISIIREIMLPTESGKILVFSFFKHTIHYLSDVLSKESIRVAVITGDTSYEKRQEYRIRFRMERTEPDAIDVLLSSEVGCEGLDYEFCSRMVNYDIPWNPMKIEQRIGRIDRFGQKSPKIRIYNFITVGTVEEKIFYRCFMRLGIFNSTIGDLEGILGDITTELTQTAFSLDLSEEQQEIRAQQLADNAIRLAQEQRKFEDESHNLFLMDIMNEDQEITKERSLQIAWQKVLISHYFRHTFGDAVCNETENHQLKLRLNKEIRQELLTDITGMKRKHQIDRNSVEAKKLEKFLSSEQQIVYLAFNSEQTRTDDSNLLISATHPLFKLALTSAISQEKTLYTALTVPNNLSAVPNGSYLFACYRWKECGYRQNQNIQVVFMEESTKQILEVELADFEKMLLSGSSCKMGQIPDLSILDSFIYQKQQASKDRLSELNQDVIQRKISTLDKYYSSQIRKAKDQYHKAEDYRMQNLYRSRVEKLENAWNEKKKEINDKAQADVMITLFAGGRLVVE